MPASESNSARIRPTLDQPDEPSPTLSYCTPGSADDAWVTLLKAFAIGAAVLGMAQLIGGIAADGLGIDKAWFIYAYIWERDANLASAIMSIAELLEELANAVLFIAAAGCYGKRPWARRLMIAGAILLIAGVSCDGVGHIMQIGAPIAMRNWAHYGILYFITAFVPRLIFPSLLIWFMTRPQVRQLFIRNP